MKKNTRRNLLVFFFVALMGLSTSAQNFYNNGNIITGTTTTNGIEVAPSGYAWSELQSVGGVANTTIGYGGFFNTAGTINARLVDDFTITSNLNISSIDFFCYQYAYSGTIPPIDQLRIQIWNGDPSLGTSVVVAGDLISNVYNQLDSGDAFMYRTVTNIADTNRKIWRVSGAITASLAPGTYWIDFQMHAGNDLAVHCPSLTIPGILGLPAWNAKRVVSDTWEILTDLSSTLPIDIPFVINYPELLGTQSFIESNKVVVYPNPASEYFNLKINDVSQSVPAHAEIFDLAGSKVMDQNLKITDSNNYPVNISVLSKGIYLVKIFDVNYNEILKTKLIKE